MDQEMYMKNSNFEEPYQDWNQQPQFEEESLEHVLASLQYNQKQPDTDESAKPPPTKKRSSDSRFTLQEDKQILKLVFQVGPNFNKIVKFFPGKTMNMVKNRYYKKLRYQKDDLQSDQEDSKRPPKSKKQQN